MLLLLVEIAIGAALLFLLGITFGKFCQLSNDDRDDFRQEWKEMNTFPVRKAGFHKFQRFFTPSRRMAQQSRKVVGLDDAKRTGKAPGKG